MSKECGKLWSSPTILTASTRTSSCLSGSPTLARMTWFSTGPLGWPSRSRWPAKMPNRTVVQNLGCATVKKLTIKIRGNEKMSIDDSDAFHCYIDLWKTAPERANGHYQGIDASDNRTRRGFESVPETEIQALPLTRPSLMSSVIASSSHLTTSCSRATCHFTRVHWATGSSMSSRLTTTIA